MAAPRKRPTLLHRTFVLIALIALTAFPLSAQESGDQPPLPARCINLGNMLEAPTEGAWGLRGQAEWLPLIADAGFDTVRIPINWSAHASAAAPYTIQPQFFERVDEVIGWSLDAGLQTIINIHHYEGIMEQPEAHRERLLALWEQIAARYQDYPPTLLFEALNEPNARLTNRLWSGYQLEALEVIRRTNPDRRVIIGGAQWNNIDQLPGLELPKDRDNLIATFHNYAPFEFTHQGAEWVDGSDAWLGTTWGTPQDYHQVAFNLEHAQRMSQRIGLPLLMGEFGAYSAADMESRVQFTRAMVEQAEANGIAWCYWEFAAGFGIYDPDAGEFNELYRALIPVTEE
jgi:endoglucanase